MAIALESSATTSHLTGTSSLSITLPSGVAEDDLVLIFAVHEADGTLTTPSGYTLLGTDLAQTGLGGNVCRIYVWYKIAGGSESNPTTTSNTNGENKKFIAHRLSGCDTSTPIPDSDIDSTNSGSGSPPSYNIDDISLSSDSSVFFRVAATSNTQGGSIDDDDADMPSGYTKRSSLTGNNAAILSIQKDSVSAGAQGTATIKTTTSGIGTPQAMAFASVGLQASSGGGGGGGGAASSRFEALMMPSFGDTD